MSPGKATRKRARETGVRMKAIQVQSEQPGNPLAWQEVDDPVLRRGEVLVDIHATALNRADLAQRAGNYPPPPGAPDILGLDMAGRIARVGEEVQGWQVGDRVCALLPGGGYAERVAVPYRMLMPIPHGWSYAEAAGMPEVFFTAFANLFMEAGFAAGETVLMHGGASGVGTAAIQLVKKAGGRMIVTAGTQEKVARCRALGADLAINYNEQDFREEVQRFTQREGVDIILDIVGAPYLARNLSLLRLKGRLVLIATLGGSAGEIDLRQLMAGRLRVIGSVLRSRSLEEKVAIREQFMEQFWPSLVEGRIKPVIDRVYAIEQAEAAHQYMAQNRNTGKIILQVKE
jgi:tumor protein p53-inducible protein 3